MIIAIRSNDVETTVDSICTVCKNSTQNDISFMLNVSTSDQEYGFWEDVKKMTQKKYFCNIEECCKLTTWSHYYSGHVFNLDSDSDSDSA